jgi:hypothetical protein
VSGLYSCVLLEDAFDILEEYKKHCPVLHSITNQGTLSDQPHEEIGNEEEYCCLPILQKLAASYIIFSYI